MIGAQVFIVLLLDCPERRYIGNPAKKSKNSSREKNQSCGAVVLGSTGIRWGVQAAFSRSRRFGKVGCLGLARIAPSTSAAALCWLSSPAQTAPSSPAPLPPVAREVSSTLVASFLLLIKMRCLMTTTFWRSPARPRPRALQVGSLRPQCAQTYPPNFQRLKIVPSATRSRTRLYHPVPGPWATHPDKPPPITMLPPALARCMTTPPGHICEPHLRV